MNKKDPSSIKLLLPLALAALLTLLVFLADRPFFQSTNAFEELVVIHSLASPQVTYPTTPPDASKITVGDPDADGYATVTGGNGAVPAAAEVVVINLNAHTVMTDTADANGAFTAELYAPPGSSLLIKYEIGPDNAIERFWNDAVIKISDASTENLNPLPGTMIYVAAPPPGDGTSQPFHAVGNWWSESPKGWAGWHVSGTVQAPPGVPPGLAAEPGEPVTITAKVFLTSPAINCTGSPTYTAAANIGLRYMFDDEGRAEPWDIWFNAHLFTPTGLPIEHEAHGEKRHVVGTPVTSFVCQSSQTVASDLVVTFNIPGDFPEGIYRPEIELFSDVPLGSTVPQAVVWYRTGEVGLLPLLRVGDPAPPRIPWTLMGDELLNGHRGLQAREDAGSFLMTTRVVFPPHQVVVPRLDARSGLPIPYRLEPGSNWLSGTERRQPPPTHIPLALPSGELIVEILKPDGKVDQLGPAVILQPSIRTPTTPGGAPIGEASGHIGDLFHLTTMNPLFDYSFEMDGPHTIFVFGEVEDIYGNVYGLNNAYDVMVARVLDLDPAQLPTTPYMMGDAFAPGLRLFPPVPADVTVNLVHMPFSDPTLAITQTVTGQANRFGYFQPPPGTEIRFASPGEFRVDISAEFETPEGELWAGYMTWGSVVEGPGALIEAHGRRGMSYKSNTIDDMPAWFIHQQLPPDKVDVDTYYPYFSGDIHWGNETPDSNDPGDSIHTVITLKDLTGVSETIYNVMRTHFPRARNVFRWPPIDTSAVGLEKRLDIGEAPLFITTQSGIDPAVEPADIDLWGYYYGSSQRPDVRVREIIAEDGMGTAYWRFNDTYGYQIGEPADGDQPGDLKWEFGGAVFRVPDQAINEYAIYSSLWVLLPHNDPVGARITPPFQDATGASINGGPIMELLGEEIDMLFLPKGVRPGDVLEVGDTISFSGHVGPPLDSLVDVTITSPTGVQFGRIWRANKIGWVYDPTFDFPANEAGRWTVDVFVEHDRPYVGNGVIPQSHNTGSVLGTGGRYEFYVVAPDTPQMMITTPLPGYLPWPEDVIEPIEIHGFAPPGTTAVHYTIHDKGVVMGQGTLVPDAGGRFTMIYDATLLHDDFPMLSLTDREGRWAGLADEVAIHFLAVGSGPSRATTVTLIGEEVFVGQSARTLFLPVVVR